MKKLAIEYMPIHDLVSYENNTKLHPQKQIDQIKASIEEFGFNDPIAINERTCVIIEGHGRLLAAQEMDIETIPIIKLGHMSETQCKAYAIAHNKLTANTGFDLKLLQGEMLELRADGFDLELTGFDGEMIERMTGNIPDIEFKEVDELIEKEVKFNECPQCHHKWAV